MKHTMDDKTGFELPPEMQCPACWGQGVVKQWPSDRTAERECKYCDGTGVVSEARCEAYYDRQRG